MTNTTQRGAIFREAVARLLRAAGFEATTEVHLLTKNVDVVGTFERDTVTGPLRYAFEAKDHDGVLQTRHCTQFRSDHKPLIERGAIDHAWLISKGPIAAQGREAAEGGDRRLKALTFAELQRRLLLLDPYLGALVGDDRDSRLAEYYVRPRTSGETDLEDHVRAWIDEPNAPPLFVLGPYGKGKSTFATHLAATMAAQALTDPTARVPILVRLGEIADEQSIEGLLGKVFASQYRVGDYHFETFAALNRAGRFLIIYDGFDEMKHGLTPAKFQTVLEQLMRLDEDDARILVLGRDTAFHDDIEFRAVIDGVERTAAGREVPIPARRAYRHVTIQGFTIDEARHYVAQYLPVRCARERDGPASDPAWVAQRVAELSCGRFDQLLSRPVHAQMLCEIAVQPDQLRSDMSVYELFDSFVHYLLRREVEKRGRDRDFPIAVRRRFNASLAWWLWERSGASTTTLADIPQEICDDAARDVRHNLSPAEMRRELIQGCLVEKGANTIYFHRSLQEFLVAEHLIATDLLQRTRNSNWLLGATRGATSEVIDFVVAGATLNVERRDRAIEWLSDLADAQALGVPLAGFDLFVKLARAVHATFADHIESPWLLWLAYHVRSGAKEAGGSNPNRFRTLADLLVAARRAPRAVQAAAVYLMPRILAQAAHDNQMLPILPVAALLPIGRFRAAIEKAQVQRSQRQIISHDDDYPLWVLLSAWRIERDADDTLTIVVDLQRLAADAQALLDSSFADEHENLGTHRFPVQRFYRALSELQPPISARDLDAIRPYFNDPQLQRALSPVKIEHRRSPMIFEPATPTRPARPVLGTRRVRPRETDGGVTTAGDRSNV